MKMKISIIKTQINDFISDRTRGHIIRSSTKFYEEGEKTMSTS